MRSLTADDVRSRLHFDPETGAFIWLAKDASMAKNRQWNGQHAGKLAGCVHPVTGYWVITISHVPGAWRLYPAHILAWLYMTGEWPTQEIDHKDRDRANNRWSNLRLATTSQNQANTGPQVNNTSGYKGVRWVGGRHRCWDARIMVNGKRVFLGLFKDKNEAAAAYAEAAKRYFQEYAA